MPFRRRMLTQAGRARRLVCAEKLRAAGLHVEIPEEWRENCRLLDIAVAGPPISEVFELPSGGVRYAILVQLVARRSGLILLGCGITTDWDDQIVLESFDDRSPVCKLGGREYRLSEVLNQRIDNYLRFAHRGYLVEGWLLASGIARIPTRFGAGAIVPFQLTFVDQFQNEISVEAELSVDRTAKQEREAARPRRGLYDVGETTEPKEAKMGRPPAPADSFSQPWLAKNE